MRRLWAHDISLPARNVCFRAGRPLSEVCASREVVLAVVAAVAAEAAVAVVAVVVGCGVCGHTTCVIEARCVYFVLDAHKP